MHLSSRPRSIRVVDVERCRLSILVGRTYLNSFVSLSDVERGMSVVDAEITEPTCDLS